MSPLKPYPEPPRVLATVNQLAVNLGREIRSERTRRDWTLTTLARKAGLDLSTIHRIEAGHASTLAGYVRVADALDLVPRFTLLPEQVARVRDVDPVHAAMGEVEARHLGGVGYEISLDEPYQHYQFAGRADLVAINRVQRALLHLENRTRFPDLQAYAGAWNQKRAYLAPELSKRLAIPGGFRSVTHVTTALWSSEVIHTLRLRGSTIRAACPDPTDAFAAWWAGTPPPTGTTSSLVLFDPIPGQRSSRRRWVGLDAIASVEPRYRGYAAALTALRVAGLA
jgi:transcriptional regulator with XRE-family HTH domain